MALNYLLNERQIPVNDLMNSNRFHEIQNKLIYVLIIRNV
jgi:hypothetical protein